MDPLSSCVCPNHFNPGYLIELWPKGPAFNKVDRRAKYMIPKKKIVSKLVGWRLLIKGRG